MPNYSTINRRINRLDVKIKDAIDDSNKFKDEYIVIATDSTCIKVTNRVKWMREKWHIRKKKDHLKIHVAFDVKTKKILSMKVTDEHVHDSKVLSELVENIIESDRITTIGKIFGDAASDNNNAFRYLSDNGICLVLK